MFASRKSILVIVLIGLALRIAAAVLLPDQSAQWDDARAYRVIGHGFWTTGQFDIFSLHAALPAYRRHHRGALALAAVRHWLFKRADLAHLRTGTGGVRRYGHCAARSPRRCRLSAIHRVRDSRPYRTAVHGAVRRRLCVLVPRPVCCRGDPRNTIHPDPACHRSACADPRYLFRPGDPPPAARRLPSGSSPSMRWYIAH